MPDFDNQDDTEKDFLDRQFRNADAQAMANFQRDLEAGGAERQSVLPIEDLQKKAEEGGGVRKVVKDVARGLTEIPGQVVGGVIEAVEETTNTVVEGANFLTNSVSKLDRWVSKNIVSLPLIKVGEDGVGVVFDEDVRGEDVNPLKLSRSRLPNIGGAVSTTGAAVRGVSRFIAGFVGAGKIKAIKKLIPTTKSGKIGKAALQGAIGDFTVTGEEDKLLSDLIQEVPSLQNPITEFLATESNDPLAEKKFKAAIEGLGLGVAVDGLVLTMKAFKNSKVLDSLLNKDTVQDIVKESSELSIKKILGDPDIEQLISTKVSESVEQIKGAPQKDTGKDIFINFARIDSDEDVLKAINELTQTFKKDINKARGGEKRTFAQVKFDAEDENAWELLMERRIKNKGTVFSDSQSLAVRKLWITSAEKLTEIATLASRNPSTENMFAFRKMLATHHTIQKEVISARTEAARALNAWRIPVGSDAEIAKQLEFIIEQSGGEKVSRALAERIAVLSNAKMSTELTRLVNGGAAFARTRSAVAQVYINAMLTSPATHVVNVLSNTSVVAQSIFERRVGAMITDALGIENGVVAGEAFAQMTGVVQGVKDALRISHKGRAAITEAAGSLIRGDKEGAKKTIVENADEFGNVFHAAAKGRTSLGVNKTELPNQGALSADTLNIAGDTWLGRSMDMIDSTTRLPGRALIVGDEFFKSVGYRMELWAQATRQATKEINEGTIKQADFKARIDDIVENPPENIRLESVDMALYQTFTNTTRNLLKDLADVVQKWPIIGRLILPFKNTPINIMSYTFERTPFAPLMKQWRADFQAGGARQALALSRISTGTALTLAAMDLAMSGRLTGGGPTNSAQRQMFWRNKQSYSVKANNIWWGINRLDPIGATLGIAADTVELMLNSQESEADYEKILFSAVLGVAKNVTSKTYMQGLSRFFDAVSDPDRYGTSYFQGIAKSFIPAGVAAIARVQDPYLRSANSSIDAMKRRLPYYSKDVPQYFDLWGRPVDFRSGLGTVFDLLSPVTVREEKQEPIDKELMRIGFAPSMPDRNASFQGATFNFRSFPDAYSRYTELAGNKLKHPVWRMGSKDLLNAVVEGEHTLSQIYRLPIYTDGPGGSRADFIRKMLRDYRKLALRQVIDEFPKLKAEINSKRIVGKGKINPRVLGGEIKLPPLP